MSATELIRLQKGATWRGAPDGRTIVFLPSQLAPLRISGPVGGLLPLLAKGCSLDELHERLAGDVGARVERRQLEALVQRLEEMGALVGQKARRRGQVRWLFDVGALVERFGLDRGAKLIVGLSLVAGIAGCLALALAALSGALRNPLAAAMRLDWLPFLLVLLILVPLHELGHALAAIATRTPLGRFGVGLRRLIVRPCVETLPEGQSASDRRRGLVAAGGPYMDVCTAGAFAGLALVTSGRAAELAGTLSACGLLLGLRNLAPGARKDGFKVLCAAFGWRPTSGGAPRSLGLPPAAARLHRRINSAYAAGFILLIAVLLVDAARV